MFKYDPEKVLCDIKFIPIEEYVRGIPHCAEVWKNGWISEDGKTFYTENRPDFLNYLLQMWESGLVPDPVFENHGGHFGRFLARSYPQSSSMVLNPPEFFEKILGGFSFSGNHLTYSQTFSIYTSDIELAHKLLRSLAKMYSSPEYIRVAHKPLTGGEPSNIRMTNDAYRRWTENAEREAKTVTFYSKVSGFWSTNSPDWKMYAQRVLDNPEAPDYSTGKFASYFMCEPSVLGLRNELDLGKILLEKMSDPAEYFNQILPWDYQLKSGLTTCQK